MSNPGQGFKSWVGIADETEWGTAVTATDFFPFETEGIVRDITKQFDRGIDGQFTEYRVRNGIDVIGGPLNTKLYKVKQLKLMKHIFGSGSSALVGSGAYDHTFGMKRPLPVGFTLGLDRDTEVWQYAGCLVNAATFSVATEGDVMLTVDILGKSEAVDAGAPTPTIIASAPFKFNEGVLTIDNSAVAVCSNFSVTINNNLRADYYGLGSNKRQGLPPNDFAEVTGTMTIAFENTDFYNKFLTGIETDLTLKFTGLYEIGGGFYFEAEFYLPRLVWTGTTPQVGGPGIIDVEYPFRCLRVDSNNLPLKLRIRNDQTSI